MIELIALHIPKTAGKSFVTTLRQVYGNENVYWSGRADIGDDLRAYEAAGVEALPSVLSGHFTFAKIAKIYRDTGAPLVTWLRDPVERVISDYFFFIMRIKTGLNRKQIHRGNEKLLEFACLPECRNRMTRFLDGIALTDLFFLGLTMSYKEDLNELARRMGWPAVEPVFVNSNQEFRARFPAVTAEERVQIKKWNEADVELYREALSLRGRGKPPE